MMMSCCGCWQDVSLKPWGLWKKVYRLLLEKWTRNDGTVAGRRKLRRKQGEGSWWHPGRGSWGRRVGAGQAVPREPRLKSSVWERCISVEGERWEAIQAGEWPFVGLGRSRVGLNFSRVTERNLQVSKCENGVPGGEVYLWAVLGRVGW